MLQRIRATFGRRVMRAGLTARATFAGAMLLGSMVAAQGGEAMRVTLDKNHILRSDAAIDTVIIGNPSVADVAAQNSQLLFVLGKSVGETNIIAFDEMGNVIFDKDVTVVPQSQRVVTLHHGRAAATYKCTPRCEPVPHTGDDPAAFGQIVGAIGSRENLISSASRGKDGER